MKVDEERCAVPVGQRWEIFLASVEVVFPTSERACKQTN